ncbi:MAG: hypothetical protein OEV35_04110 [Gallionellaceae bacterium]|nr:hypothetical protein [Gallionellaceae bacterium]
MRFLIILSFFYIPFMAYGAGFQGIANFADYVSQFKLQGTTVDQAIRVLKAESFNCHFVNSGKLDVIWWCARQESGIPCAQKQIVSLHVQPQSNMVNKAVPELRDICL